MISLILLVFALVLFVIASLLTPALDPWRLRLTSFGLACWVASEIFRNSGPPR